MRDGRPVGRIAAIINRSHNAHNRDTVGFFGFFDSVNDPSVARELLAAAEGIIRSRGLTSMRGPYNPSINDDCGILTEGNDRPSFVSMPWNPPHYAAMIEAAGFMPVRTLYAWDVPLDGPMPERVNRIADRIGKRQRATIRTIDLANIRGEMEIIHRLYNQTLDRNWGFYPIALEDLLHAADDLKAIADPETIFFICMDGREVGFSLALPNVNEVFRASRGRKGLLRLLEMALRLKFQRITSQRLCVLGVEPSARDKGLSALLFFESFRSAKRKYALTEVSWVEANNEEILEGAAIMGGKRSRTYVIFEKPVTDSLPQFLSSQVLLIDSQVWDDPASGGFFRLLERGLADASARITVTGRQFRAMTSCSGERFRGHLAGPGCNPGPERLESLQKLGLVDLSVGTGMEIGELSLEGVVLDLVARGTDVTLFSDDPALRIGLRQLVADAPGKLLLPSARDFRS
jgi:hypothetical protein